MNILFVDDDSAFLQQVKMFLEKGKKPINVTTSHSAEEALTLFETQKYDAIVSNYWMPQIDGLKLLEIIRKDRKSDIPFIFFTGEGSEEVAMNALNLGANRYLKRGKNPNSQYKILVEAIVEEVEYAKNRENGKLPIGEKDFIDIFNRARDPIFLHKLGEGGVSGKIMDVNDIACEILGYSREEFSGLILSDIILESSENDRVIEKLFEEGYAVFEAEFKVKDGGKIPVEVHSHLFKVGGEDRVLSMVRDISERKRMEEKYHICVQGSSDGIYVFQDGEFKFVNSAFVKISGYSFEELKELDFLDLIHPDYREDIENWTKQALTGDISGLPAKYEFKGLRKDGSSIWVQLNPSLAEFDGKNAIVGNIVNFSDRKEMEEKLKQYKVGVEASNDSIYMIDKNHRYIFANDEHISRLASDGKISSIDKDWIIGKKFRDIHVGEGCERFERNISRVFETGESQTEEYKFSIEDRWSSRTYSPVRNPKSGEIEAVVIVSKDITGKKKAEERQDFLHSLLRHDVRNKAQIVQGYHELLRGYDLPERAEGYLENAVIAVKDCINLIEKVSTLRKVSEGMEVKNVNLGGIIGDAISESKPQAEEKDVEVVLKNVDFYVQGGHFLLELFSNLLENSIIHSECKEINISAREKGEELVVSIEDDGRGIPDEDKEKIFERGYKKGKDMGSGMGLYLVKKIAESYGGSVEIKNSELGGARFDVHINKA